MIDTLCGNLFFIPISLISLTQQDLSQYPFSAWAVFVFPIPFAILIALFVHALYRHAVLRSMLKTRTNEHREQIIDTDIDTKVPISKRIPEIELKVIDESKNNIRYQASSEHLIESSKRHRQIAFVYTLAGILYSAVATIIMFRFEGLEFFLLRTTVVFFCLLWPLLVAYLVILSPRFQPAYTGPVILGFMFALIGILWMYFFSGSFLRTNFHWTSFLLGSIGVIVLIIAIGGPILAYLRWTALRRPKTKTSGQMVFLNSLWVLNTFLLVIIMLGGFGFKGFVMLLPYIIFKCVLWIALKPLENDALVREEKRLLLLRTFGSKKRSVRLLRMIHHHWKPIGDIHLLASPDLASATLDPDEFLDFISGKLHSRFVNNQMDLDSRLSQEVKGPNRDGTYRVSEFFCYENTWKLVFHTLAKESDFVLMDLREFNKARAGCQYELEQLINLIKLESVLLIIDDTTDEDLLRETIDQARTNIRSDSPNISPDKIALRLFKIRYQHRYETAALMNLMLESI